MRHARMTTAVLLLLCAAAALYGQGKHGGGTPSAALSLYRLPPLERAILCTKYHEGWHGEKKHWPYVGWGHRVLPESGLPTASPGRRATPSCGRT